MCDRCDRHIGNDALEIVYDDVLDSFYGECHPYCEVHGLRSLVVDMNNGNALAWGCPLPTSIGEAPLMCAECGLARQPYPETHFEDDVDLNEVDSMSVRDAANCIN